MILRILISVFFITTIPYSGFSVFSITSDSIVENIFTLIYNQQFDEAEIVLSSERGELDVFYSDVLNIDLHWWKFSTSRSRHDARNLKLLLKENTQSGNRTEEEKIRELIKKSYRLRYERKRYNLIKAAFVKAEINKMLPEFNKEDLSLSGERLKLFELYISMFQYFDTINPFTLLEKSERRLKPLRAMEEFSLEENLIVRTMAHYFLGRIYQKIEREPEKGKAHFEALTKEYPNNLLFKEHLIDCSK